MMKCLSCSFFFVLLLVLSATAFRVEKGLDVSRDGISASSWELRGPSDPHQIVPFSIAMRQRNLGVLKQKLLSVSDPESNDYGNYWTREQVENLVKTSEEDKKDIIEWLESNEISRNQCEVRNGDILQCSAPVSSLEALLQCELFSLTHKTDASRTSITHLGRLSVPSEIAEKVDLIQGLSFIPFRKAIFKDGEDPFGEEKGNSFEAFVSRVTRTQAPPSRSDSVSSVDPAPPVWNEETETASCPSSAPVGCSTSNGVSSEFCCGEHSVCCPAISGGSCCLGGTTCCRGECVAASSCEDPIDILVQPETLRDHYSVPKNLRAAENYFNQSVVAFTDEYSTGALDIFVATLNEPAVEVTRYGPQGCLPNCDQVESDLDMQYMSSMGSGVGLWFWYNAQGYTLEWAQEVLSVPNAPLVYSISYISGEYQLGQEYIQRSNTEFVKMGTLGITVMACSGDTGAPGWSINFPVDPHARNFPFDCPLCPLGVNYCNQITATLTDVFGDQLSCNVPSGMYSRDLKRGLPCDIVMANQDCAEAIDAFMSDSTTQSCDFSIVQDIQQVPRVFSLGCECSDLPSVTHGNCTISGFDFDPSNGSPLTSLYPASSPFATAVGATQFSELTNYLCLQEFGGSQIECDIGEVVSSIATKSRITSGGGFSTMSPAEPYQSQAVSEYLESGVPLPTGFYNDSLRAYPDIAFGGHNWLISFSKDSGETCPCEFSTVDGTSCASPGFAGLVSLLNQQLVAAGHPVLGLLNPVLYSMAKTYPQAFQDITSGDNYCTEYVCSDRMGYRAAVGWDAATGLGSPHFENMLSYLLNL